jgi:bacterial/archaeal transporter family-2 protein
LFARLTPLRVAATAPKGPGLLRCPSSGTASVRRRAGGDRPCGREDDLGELVGRSRLRRACAGLTRKLAPPLIVRAQAGAGALEQAARERFGWIVLGLAAGVVLPVQGAINAELNGELDAAIAVGAFSFPVATGAMALGLGGALAAGAPRPKVTSLRSEPWWGWLGGACGASYVTAVFSLIPEIGAAAVVVLTVAGQQLASIAVDCYGLLRLPRSEISPRRLLGVAILLAGVALITRA